MASKRFTKEQMAYLAKHEDNLWRAYRADWCRNIVSKDVETIAGILKDAHGIDADIRLGCGSCTLELMKTAGRLYFAQKKADAQAKADAPEKKAPARKKTQKKATGK